MLSASLIQLEYASKHWKSIFSYSTLQPATRTVTKAWAAHGGWPTSIPTRAIRAAWPHYGDARGDEVKAAYTRHTALLLHCMTHNHSPEVREVTTIRLEAA